MIIEPGKFISFNTFYVMGTDPGLANLGISIVEIGETYQKVIALYVLTTEKSDKKHKILASDDNVQRAREMWKGLQNIVKEYRPSCICSESQSIPRNAGAAAKTAFAWGLLAALAESLDIPMPQSSPQAMKKLMCGKRDASKEEVEIAVRKMFPEASPMLDRLTKTRREHAADSLAAVVACQDSDAMRMIRQSVIRQNVTRSSL